MCRRTDLGRPRWTLADGYFLNAVRVSGCAHLEPEETGEDRQDGDEEHHQLLLGQTQTVNATHLRHRAFIS